MSATSRPGDEVELPPDVRASVVELRSGRYLLLSFTPGEDLPRHGLTESERFIALALLRGCTNDEIARLRGTSPRTVANQVASIFRKLGVHSRAEMAAQWAGSIAVGRR